MIMKKIMFNDRYGLTRKVLSGYKTQTRRIIPDIEIDWVRRGKVHLPVGGYEDGVLFMDVRSILHDAGISDYVAPAKYQPKYEKGEEVAVAQSYRSVVEQDPDNDYGNYYVKQFRYTPGWTNKMFVRPDLMPHRIKITDIRLQRLYNISDEDCLCEGVYFYNCGIDTGFKVHGIRGTFSSAREAFAELIDKISGKGTWQRNPWVFIYEFELIK